MSLATTAIVIGLLMLAMRMTVCGVAATLFSTSAKPNPEGNKYLDCLSAYSALNQGHRHPRIIDALVKQAGKCTLTSRAFHNDVLGPFMELIANMSEMEMILPMNTGAEAVETAIKAARKTC